MRDPGAMMSAEEKERIRRWRGFLVRLTPHGVYNQPKKVDRVLVYTCPVETHHGSGWLHGEREYKNASVFTRLI